VRNFFELFCGSKPAARAVSLIAVILLPLISGCMHYSKESCTAFGFDRVYVDPAENDAFAPQAQAMLTEQLRMRLAIHPGLQLAQSPKNAAVVRVTIIGVERMSASVRDSDPSRAKSFDIAMSLLCSLIDEKTGRFYFKDYTLSDSVECLTYGDYREAEHQIMPQLTAKLASKIYEIVCNPW
jgi:hypothetical protein